MVIRINEHKVKGFEQHVGTKTSFRMFNNKVLKRSPKKFGVGNDKIILNGYISPVHFKRNKSILACAF